jgi:hypothetical protein
MPRISEEMRRWTDTLGRELADWPGVWSQPMFGLTAFYHGDVIFACLPKTRSIRRPNVVFVKFDPLSPALLRRMATDPRLEVDVFDARSAEARWLAFEMNADEDLSDALWWLGTAYETAVKKPTAVAKAPRAAKKASPVKARSTKVKAAAKKAAKSLAGKAASRPRKKVAAKRTPTKIARRR